MQPVTFRNLLNASIIGREGNTLMVAMDVDEQTLNPIGSVHGGAIYTLADTACGSAAILGSGGFVTTISGSINYLRAAINQTRLIAHATVIKAGKAVIFVSCDVYAGDGTLCANGQFTFHPLGIPCDYVVPDGYRAPEGQKGISLDAVVPPVKQKEK